MMKKEISAKKRKIKEPTKSMGDYYGKMFCRNQSKWIRRSKLEPSHLGTEFTLEGEKAKLIGTLNPEDVIIQLLETNEFWVVHIDDVTEIILQ